jgi:catechol 1,2-dioxygenase
MANDVQCAPTLPIEATVTEAVGNVGEHSIDHAALAGRLERDPTEDDVLGPYYRRGAPFRAKVSPPLSSGDVLQISGRVWGVKDRHPVGGALLDIWQANARGHYDNDDPTHPPGANNYTNRTRLFCSEEGNYEFETIYPGPYKMDEHTWRSPHIHFIVRAVGFKTLVTQLFFEETPYLDTDPFVKRSLIIPLTKIDTQLKGHIVVADLTLS